MSIDDSKFLNADPFEIFNEWFNEARITEINDPDAIALATVNKEGFPSVRMVLLKEYNKDGFIFYTNYNSRKANELFDTQKASFVIDELKLENTLISTSFENMQILEKEKGFIESKIDLKTGKKIRFFNLGAKNRWEKLLDINVRKKIENSFEKEMKELNYL